jgi:replicative DNA helicase
MTTASTLPNNLVVSKSAEAACLGSMIYDSKVIPGVLEWVDSQSFVFPEHRAIFEAILTVWRRNPGGALDGVLLRNELEKSKALESVGGLDYLRQVVESVPSSANAMYYSREVAERQRYRSAVDAIEQMRQRVTEGGPVDEIVQRVQELAMGLECQPQQRNIYRVQDHASEVAIQTQESPCVIATGFSRVDRLAAGVCPGDVAYVAARPSIGKTAFVCGWALNAAKAGTHVAFFTLEMTARALMERLSATLGCVSLARVKRRDPPKEMLDAFYGGSLLLEGLPITIIENAGTVEQVTAALRQLEQGGPVGLVMIDYIGLMTATDSRRWNRNEQLTEISRGLKRLAQSEHVPVVVVAQLNRECEGRANHRPRMSDLRDSGAQEQDADVVMLLHREDYFRKVADPATTQIDGLAEVLIAKARNGPTGIGQLVFLEEQLRFADLSDASEPGGVDP